MVPHTVKGSPSGGPSAIVFTMEIKSKTELVQRAKDHLAADHFVQEFYVRFTGEDLSADFKGCEIGCLAMPVKEATRAEVVSELLKSIKGEYGGDTEWEPTPDALNDHSAKLVKINEDTFGICAMLQRLAESFFERLPREEAGPFVVEFTESLPEGAKIDNDDVFDWCAQRNEVFSQTPASEEDEYEDKAWYPESWGSDPLTYGIESGSYQDIETEKEAFLAWLEAKAAVLA